MRGWIGRRHEVYVFGHQNVDIGRETTRQRFSKAPHRRTLFCCANAQILSVRASKNKDAKSSKKGSDVIYTMHKAQRLVKMGRTPRPSRDFHFKNDDRLGLCNKRQCSFRAMFY
jgi:hypothetical protein